MPRFLVSLPDRLDTFLATKPQVLSRARAQRAIERGEVAVNEEIVTKPAHRLQEGDAVELETGSEEATATIEPIDLRLEVLYEDAACAVIDKPAGIAVHPGAGMAPGERTILNGIAFLYEGWGLHFSASSVLAHRLDKETTGCLLVAKTPAAHLALQRQFADRLVDKRYLALVAGIPSPASAVIDAPIGRSVSHRTRMDVIGVGKSRDARTTYRTLATSSAASGGAALLECTLHTGRTHQVRVHLAAIRHPVLGDGTYATDLGERISQEFDIRSLCLHAWKLTFRSPADAREHAVVAPVPRALRMIAERLGIAVPDS